MKVKNFKIKLAILIFILPVSLFPQKSVYDLRFSNDTKLVSLNYEVSEEAIAAVYYPKWTIVSKQNSDDNLLKTGQVASFRLDEKTYDTKMLLNNYLNDIIDTQGLRKYGKIELNVIYFEQRKQGTPFLLFNFITIGMGSLMGVPSYRITTKVELSMCIYDNNERLLCCHSGIGIDKYFINIYKQKNERESNRNAVKKALTKINTKLSEEIELLNKKLLASDIAYFSE